MILYGRDLSPFVRRIAIWCALQGREVERRPIKIGTVEDKGVTIAEGVSGNERVVLSAGPFLNPGQKVKPQVQASR